EHSSQKKIKPNLAPRLPAEQRDAPSRATPVAPAPETLHAKRSSVTHLGRRAGRTSPHLHTKRKQHTSPKPGSNEARQRHQGETEQRKSGS
ncbi:Os05g0419050, partial [Oryza sativa Japonica Group]